MKHTARGVLSAWMVLVVLRTVGTAGGSSKLAGMFTDVNNLVTRALSPDVPAIPDHRRTGKNLPTGYITPAQAAAGAKAGAAAGAVAAVTSPGGLLYNMPSLGAYVAGGGLPGIEDNPALQPGYLPGNP